jgi:MerR family transcriptional regulator, light-induced transcriptional regulator
MKARSCFKNSTMGSAMAQAANVLASQVIDRQSLYTFEKHFIAPEIYQRSDVATRQIDLARIVSNDIIPRLLRLHREILPDAPPVDDLIQALAPSGADIDSLAHIVIGDDLQAAATYVTVLRDRGLSMETLYIELLEPTARHLGKMWDEDECDFIDVTIGVARLQKLLAIFNDTYDLPDLATRRQVLMALAPGNQHSFGASMIDRLLFAAGWQVQTEYSGIADDIVQAVQQNWFAVVGLTVGSDGQLDSLKSVIADVRKASQNAHVGILVGGSMFTENPALATSVGADATAPNAPAAVLAAQKLFDAAIANRT